ncbi:MAG: LPXTG cell wall anchor domain-containing protein [Propionibacteriaceae bacterium]|nr:LPXTG cell wall anchor domain-containing protein [Propionibacteriaceae bacterium]
MLGAVPLADAIVITGNTNGVSFTTIDVNRTATLILHKKAPNPYNTTPVADLPAGTIAGVTFSVKRVAGVDLGSQEGWDWVRYAEVDDVYDGPFDREYTARTDYEGFARVDGVPVGVYLVAEEGIDNPSHLYRKSAPFLITVPSGSADGTLWDYEILVNTKDAPDAPPTTPPDESTPSETPPGKPPPGTPGTPDTPGSPETNTTDEPAPGSPDEPGQPGRGITSLPITGAGVLQVLAVGGALILAGIYLMRRRRQA